MEYKDRYKKGQRWDSIISDWRNDQNSQSISRLATSGKKSRGFTEVRGLFPGKEVREFVLCVQVVVRPRGWVSKCIFTGKTELELQQFHSSELLSSCSQLTEKIICKMCDNEDIDFKVQKWGNQITWFSLDFNQKKLSIFQAVETI